MKLSTCTRRNVGFLAFVSLSVFVSFSAGWGGGHGHGNQSRKAENWSSVDRMHLYLCAFHVAKENPKFQLIAHHYCAPQKGDVHQCVIYDSRKPDSKLLGVEYIVSDETYRSLPEEEKKYWHPHAYEILSGQLMAPEAADLGDEMLAGLITTWGKTWHTWRDPSTTVPLGEPLLMWSSNGDNQVDPSLISQRDAEFGVSTDQVRQRRKKMGFEMPQVPPPKSINELGRQWTSTGADQPTRTAGK